MSRTAVELAAASSRVGSPGEGLRAVAELRRRLEELEAWHVRNALEAGRSWAEIAACLGVSKQAAHKKHAARLKKTAQSSFATAAREQGIVVTAEARRVVQYGTREARDFGHGRLGTGHLLLGLLREQHDASTALGKLGISLDRVRGAIRKPEAPAERRPEARMPVSAQARTALERSLREALDRGDRHLGAEHLLLALLRDEASDAFRTLAKLGVSSRELEEALVRRPRRRGRNVRSHA